MDYLPEKAPPAVYFGVFIDLPPEPEKPATPTSAPVHKLRVRRGITWVDKGLIAGQDWSVKTEEDLTRFLRSKDWFEQDEAKELIVKDEELYRRSRTVRVIRSSRQRNSFFFPGFVDTHIHAPQYQNAGIVGNSTLLEWLEKYTFPLESSYDTTCQLDGNYKKPHDIPSLAYDRVIQRTLSHGTTCAAYFGTIHVLATAILAHFAAQRVQRALIGRVCMDSKDTCPSKYRDESLESCIDNTKSTIAEVRKRNREIKDLLNPIITPRFAPSCSREALKALGDLAASENPPIRIQTHLSENENEVKWVKSLFPDKKSYTDVYDGAGLLTPRTILAHAVHLSPEERALIKKRGASISHCPASNSAIGSGICPVRALLDDGIPVGLGTDVSAGWSPSILEAVRQTCLVSRLYGFTRHYVEEAERKGQNGEAAERHKISTEEALYLATRGGARVVSMDGPNGIGGFDIGKQFDAQVIELGSSVTEEDLSRHVRCHSNVDIFGWETWEEKVQKWVWNGDDRNVRGVWVAGRYVHGDMEGLEDATLEGLEASNRTL